MPRTTRALARRLDNSTTIELTIPLRMAGAGAGGGGGGDGESDGDAAQCYICANDFCAADDCCRTMTHLGCCTQAVCCGCLSKVVKRCRCTDECEAVIALCPFCREVSPVVVLDVHLGHAAVCKLCEACDAKSPAVHDSPEPEPRNEGIHLGAGAELGHTITEL
jgi:hypothetical protein